MVTHDRYFLNRVVNRIIELDRRQLISYPGNYMRYLEQSAEQHERLVKAKEDRRRALRRELEWLRRSPMARGAKQKARIVPGEALDYFVIYGPTPKEVLAHYTALTGRRSRPRGRSGCGSPHPSPHPTTRRPSPVSSRAWPIAISRCTSSIAGDAVQKDPLGALLIPHADAGTVTVRLVAQGVRIFAEEVRFFATDDTNFTKAAEPIRVMRGIRGDDRLYVGPVPRLPLFHSPETDCCTSDNRSRVAPGASRACRARRSRRG